MSNNDGNPASAPPPLTPTLPGINADHPTWGPRLKSIVDEITPFYPPEFTDLLSEPWRERVLWVRTAAGDLLHAMTLYIEAFNAIRQIKFLTATPLTVNWVFHTDYQRSVTIQLGTIVIGFCSLLEATLPDMASAFVVDADAVRLRRKRTVKTNDTEARAQLIRWVNPTAKGDEKWPERVADVFDFSLNESAREALRSMLQLRHAYIHERAVVLAAGIPADELNSWFFATMLITTLAGKAVSERLKV